MLEHPWMCWFIMSHPLDICSQLQTGHRHGTDIKTSFVLPAKLGCSLMFNLSQVYVWRYPWGLQNSQSPDRPPPNTHTRESVPWVGCCFKQIPNGLICASYCSSILRIYNSPFLGDPAAGWIKRLMFVFLLIPKKARRLCCTSSQPFLPCDMIQLIDPHGLGCAAGYVKWKAMLLLSSLSG